MNDKLLSLVKAIDRKTGIKIDLLVIHESWNDVSEVISTNYYNVFITSIKLQKDFEIIKDTNIDLNSVYKVKVLDSSIDDKGSNKRIIYNYYVFAIRFEDVVNMINKHYSLSPNGSFEILSIIKTNIDSELIGEEEYN